jgi:hypothetical protein
VEGIERVETQKKKIRGGTIHRLLEAHLATRRPHGQYAVVDTTVLDEARMDVVLVPFETSDHVYLILTYIP